MLSGRLCFWYGGRSFCKRVEAHDRWCEVEDAVTSLRLFDSFSLPTLTHGLCFDCYERAAALLD